MMGAGPASRRLRHERRTAQPGLATNRASEPGPPRCLHLFHVPTLEVGANFWAKAARAILRLPPDFIA